jgi:alpha-tubulin suppressor-like RCC1 family protein
MTQLLRCQIPCEEVAVTELYNSLISQLAKANLVQTLAIQGSNINFTLGDGTQDSSQRLKFLPELKGRTVLQAVCGEFHSLVLASSCVHLSKGDPCPSDFQKCSGGLDVLAWGENSHGQVLGVLEIVTKKQEIVKKPLAIEDLVGLETRIISTYKHLSAAACKSGVKIWGEVNQVLNIKAETLACGSNFVVIFDGSQILLWGECSYEGGTQATDLRLVGSFNVAELAAGLAHALALDVEGQVYSFGHGQKGELGQGTSVLFSESFSKVSIPRCSKVLSHGQISVAISGSTVYVWGFINPEELESASCKF